MKIQDKRDHFKLNILDADFDNMADGLIKNAENIQLSYERIDIPEVSLKVGNKVVRFSPEKIQNLIHEKHEAIKGILLAQIANTLKSNTTHAAFEVLESYKIKKEFWLNTSTLNSQFKISDFSSYGTRETLAINMPGDFCTAQKYSLLKANCIYNKVTLTALSRLTKRHHEESLSLMSNMMVRGDANLVVSISEDYLNKLIVTTYDAGLWKKALDQAGVELGPNKVILRMDKRGESGTLIMDVIYKPSRMEKLMTGSTQIRFPLVVDVSLRIENKNDIPNVIVRLNDIDMTDETLIYGRPADQMVSTVKDIPRFKSKVAKAIREKVLGLAQQDLLELPYPEFKGLGLDKVDFLSDGNGRMNAIMDLDEMISVD